MKLLNIFALILTSVDSNKETSDFSKTIEILWKGMLAIFVAIGVIYLFIILLNYFNNLKGKKNKK